MNDRLDGQVAVVTGGGRGIGRSIALELADAGMRIAVSARSREQVEDTARHVGGRAFTLDVSDADAVEDMIAQVERGLGPVDLLVNNAGVHGVPEPIWEQDPADWWRVFEINVLGAYLCGRAVLRRMAQRRRGRIVNVGSGAAYLPGSTSTSYAASKAALGRFSETLAEFVAPYRISVFTISPGLVRTGMTIGRIPDDADWTPPELAPTLVRVLASGRADALAGRYIHAEHDDIEDLIVRADGIRREDLNAIRLRR